MKRLLFACLLLAGVAGTAVAQAPEDDAHYQTAISEAVAEFSAGRWEEARSLFTEAHRINPNSRTLRGLGMTAFELRNYVEALQMLQRALDSQVNPLTQELRQKTEDLLDRTRAFVGVFAIEAPEGTALAVDGVAPAYDNTGHLLLNTGKRKLGIRFSDGAESTRLVDVRGGEQGTLVFERPAAGPSPAPPPVPVPVGGSDAAPMTAGGSASVSSDGGGAPVLPWVLVGVGGALVAGGVVTGLLAKGAESDLEDACADRMTSCPIENRDTRDKATTLATVTNVLWVGGAVMAALGVTLFVIEGDDESPAATASLNFAPDAAGVNVWGQF